jgi:hypothetical protein
MFDVVKAARVFRSITNKLNNLQNLILILMLVVVTLPSYFFRYYIPVDAGNFTPGDDLLGIRIAQNILDGKWLGEWNNLTLIKPSGYSIYLALAHFLPVPLVLVTHTIFVVSSWVLVYAFLRFVAGDGKSFTYASVIPFSYLIYSPFLFQPDQSRVYRSSLENALIYSFVCVFFVLICVVEESKNKNRFSNRLPQVITAILAAIYSILVLTKSSSYWILVGFFLPFAFLELLQALRRKRVFIEFKKIMILVCTFLLVSLIPISLYGQVNQTKYGLSLTEDYYQGSFKRALVLWQSVENGKDERPFIPVSKGQRAAVYEVSPTANLLKPYLEGAPNTGWRTAPCSIQKVCDESASWFPWELRDAAVQTGVVSNAIEFQSFFDKISFEISEACEREKLDCGHLGSGPGMRSYFELPVSLLIEYSWKNVRDSWRYNLGGRISTPDNNPGWSTPESVNEFHSVVNYRAEPLNTNKKIPTVSEKLATLENLYSKTFMPVLALTIICSILHYRVSRNRQILIFPSVVLFGTAVYSLGISTFQVSLGWQNGGIYFLPLESLQTILLGFGLLATVSFARLNLGESRKNAKNYRSRKTTID